MSLELRCTACGQRTWRKGFKTAKRPCSNCGGHLVLDGVTEEEGNAAGFLAIAAIFIMLVFALIWELSGASVH